MAKTKYKYVDITEICKNPITAKDIIGIANRCMSAKEIEANIQKELRHIERLKHDIENAKYDIKATRKAVAFWKKELAKAKKGGNK